MIVRQPFYSRTAVCNEQNKQVRKSVDINDVPTKVLLCFVLRGHAMFMLVCFHNIGQMTI